MRQILRGSAAPLWVRASTARAVNESLIRYEAAIFRRCRRFRRANDAPSAASAFADFASNAAKISHHHFGVSGESGAQFFVLRGDAHGASVQVALARHHATDGEQRGRAETKFVGAQQRGDDYVAPKFKSAIDAQTHAVAKA